MQLREISGLWSDLDLEIDWLLIFALGRSVVLNAVTSYSVFHVHAIKARCEETTWSEITKSMSKGSINSPKIRYL